MSLKHIETGTRFRFVANMERWRDDERYNQKTLREMPTPKNNMTEEDFTQLDKILRGIKRS